MTYSGDSYESILRQMANEANVRADKAQSDGEQADEELYGKMQEILENAATRVETEKAAWQLYA